MNTISPEQYFFRHAFGGCYRLLIDGEITLDDYQELLRLAQTGEHPPEPMLRDCFPLSSQAIRSFDDITAVRNYWYHHHTGDAVCTPSGIVRIRSIFRRGGRVWVEAETNDIVGQSDVIGVEGVPIFENIFRLPLGRAKYMCVHGPIITEFLYEQ